MTPFYNNLFHFESAKLLGELLLKILLTQGNRNHQPRPKNVFFLQKKERERSARWYFLPSAKYRVWTWRSLKSWEALLPFSRIWSPPKEKKSWKWKKVEIANVERRTTSNASPSRLQLRQRLREWDATSKPRTSNCYHALSSLVVQKTNNPSIVPPHTL